MYLVPAGCTLFATIQWVHFIALALMVFSCQPLAALMLTSARDSATAVLTLGVRIQTEVTFVLATWVFRATGVYVTI